MAYSSSMLFWRVVVCWCCAAFIVLLLRRESLSVCLSLSGQLLRLFPAAFKGAREGPVVIRMYRIIRTFTPANRSCCAYIHGMWSAARRVFSRCSFVGHCPRGLGLGNLGDGRCLLQPLPTQAPEKNLQQRDKTHVLCCVKCGEAKRGKG